MKRNTFTLCLNDEVLYEIDTALANDAYYKLQSLLKDEQDDYNDDDVELEYEETREEFEIIRALHHERAELYNNYVNHRINRIEFQEGLFEIKEELSDYLIELGETNAVFEEYGLD